MANKESQTESEWQVLREYCKLTGQNPEDFSKANPPAADFRHRNGSIALELVEYFRDAGKQGSPRLEKQRTLETILRSGKALYGSSAPCNVLVDRAVVNWMNLHASAFFQQHQSLLIGKIFLELAKLFDPAEDRQKNQNFSLKHLMKLTPPSVANEPSLNAQFKKAKNALGNIPTLRNKILCHNDCGLGNENISESLQTIKTSLDEVKRLFQMCCGTDSHRFTLNIYPARTLINWMSSSTQKSETPR